MSTQYATQLAQLKSAITHFDAHKAQVLPAFFSPVLFPSDPHTVAEAQQVMAQTLKALSNTGSTQAAQFYAEQFIGQYRALAAALHTHTKTGLPAQRQDGSQLPPRERLNLYYTFLARLKTKLEEQQNLQLHTPSVMISRQVAHTQARIARCQSAIEQLEDYLAFTKRRDERKSAV